MDQKGISTCYYQAFIKLNVAFVLLLDKEIRQDAQWCFKIYTLLALLELHAETAKTLGYNRYILNLI